MGPPIRVGVALWLLFFVGGSFAGPLLNKDEPECFNGLPVGKTFVYQYSGISKIENEDVDQKVNFSADVVVSVPRECVLAVQLKNVVSPHQKFVDTLQNDAIEVRLNNGVLSGLKHSTNEPAWALNVKRAIVSMLQVPFEAREVQIDVEEKDVLGICKTSYVPQGSADDKVEIKKSKALLTCEGRTESGRSVFFTPYTSPVSEIRTLPVADGSHDCEIVMSKSTGVISKVRCQQSEQLLISQQASATPGVISTVSSEASLELLREETGAQSIRSAAFQGACLVFDHLAEMEQPRESLASAVDRYCESMKADVRPETGKLFGDLITSMRSSSSAKISEVYKSLDNKPCDTKKLKSDFLDVLGLSGSSSSIEMIAKFIENGEHEQYHKQWLNGMTFLVHPTQEMVMAMVPVVQAANANNAKQVLLPVSAMANTFCKIYGDDCEETIAIKQLLSALVKKISNGCSADRKVVVATLKALGNLGVNSRYIDNVMQCVNEQSTDIRMYALRAFRKVCDAELTQQMLALYADQSEDVEVRIGAYVNAMRCANFETMRKIVEIYEQEKIMQVGSFVYSHMRVIHDSECPLKAELKRMIASFPVSSKFSSDPSKFSQNFEFSRFFDTINYGAAAEASVVFSPQSFLPRSANLNLTLNLFSQSLNILEVGGRAEGLEKLFEQFFGPQASGPRRSRYTRATQEDTNVAVFDKDHKNEIPTGEKMSFYVNMFGNEIDYVEFDSVKELSSELLASAFKLVSLHPSNLLSSLVVQGEVDLAKNALLVDRKFSTATITGLGLVFDLRAVGNVALKASAPVQGDRSKINASLEPSAVVQVDGSLTLNSGAFRHGARFTSTIHTSSVVDIEVTRREGEFKFRFNTPRDRIEVLNAKAEVFSIQGDYETPITAKNVRNFDGCTIQLPEIFGMSACISGSVPKPWYMAKRGFVKPYNFGLTLDKTDKTMEGVEFSIRQTDETFSMVLDTPGSTVDRRRELNLKKTDSSFSVQGSCPRRTFHFEINTVEDDFVSFKLTNKQTREQSEYALTIRNGLGSIFVSPELYFEARCPHLTEPATLTIKSSSGKTEISSNYPKSNPLKFVQVYDDSRSTNTTLSVGELEASTRYSQISTVSPQNWHMIFHTTYKIGSNKAQKFHYELKLKTDDSLVGKQRSGVSTWTSTCHPQYNHKIAFESHLQADNRKHKIQAWWGEKFTDETKTIRIVFNSKQKGSLSYGKSTSGQIYSEIFSPAWNLDYELNFDRKIDLEGSPRITASFFVASNKKSIIEIDGSYNRHGSKTSIQASLIAPNTSLKFTDESEKLSKGKHEGTTNIEWGSEGKKLTIDYSCDVMENANHAIKMTIRAPNMKPITYRQLVRIARDVELKTETLIDGKEYIVFEVKKDNQDVAFNFLGQKLQINYSRQVKDKAVDVKLDIKSKVLYTRPVSLVIHKDSPGKRSHNMNLSFMWDAVANPDKKLVIVLSTDREDGVKSHVKINVAQYVDFEYKGVYVKGFIKGPNRAEFRLSGANFESRELIVGHVHSQPKGEGYLTYTRGGKILVDAKIGHEYSNEKRYHYLTVTGLVNRKLTITRDLVARVLTVDLDRDGKLYKLVVDGKTHYSQGIIDCKITLTLPYEQYKSQELTVKGTISGGNIDLTVHYLSSTNKNYHLIIKGTRPEKLVLDVEITITSDNEKLKEGKAHLKYNLAHPTDREFILTIDRGSTRVFDAEVKSKKIDDSKEVNFKLSSEFTPSYIGTMKMVGNPQKFKGSTSITKNGEPYYTAENEFENTGSKMMFKGRYKGGLFGDSEIDFEKNTLPGDNHRTYKLNIKNKDREVKADAETQRVDGFKITSVNMCRTPLESNCVSVTVRRNTVNFDILRNNAINIKIHRKPDVTLEIDGQLHAPSDVHKVHARLVGNINEFKLGFDYNCDHPTEQLSEQSLRGYVVDREMLATRRREQTDKFIDIKYTATFDAKSDEKLEATYRRDYNDKGYNSIIKLSHPKMRTPVVLKCELSKGKDAGSLVRLESQLEFFKPEDTIFFHFERRINDQIARNRSVHFHIHKADKTVFDTELTLYRSEDLQKPVFAGYLWSYTTAKKEVRQGSMRAFLGEDLKGSIEFTSPYQDDFKITGEAKKINEEGDKEAEIVLLKNGVETKGKISYNMDKLYMKAVVLNADGTTKRELEVDGGRKEKGRYKVILSSFPEGKRTTDLGIEHTRSSETSFHSRVYAPPDYLKRVAERAKEIAATRAGKYPIEDIKEELKVRSEAFAFRVRKTFEDVPEHILTRISQIFVEIQGSLTRLINNTTVGQRLKAKFEANREKIAEIMRRFIEYVRKCCPSVAERLEKMMEQYLPKRTRRSVQEDEANLVEYVMERYDALKEWFSEIPPVKTIINISRRIVNGVEGFWSRMVSAVKSKLLSFPDVKQVAETWAELYDSSSVGHLLPREALCKYVLRPRLMQYAPRVPVLEVDRKAGRFVADVDIPVDTTKLVEYWAYGGEAKKVTTPSKQPDFFSVMEMIKKTVAKTFDGRATVIDGKHFITFDGKHFSAQGSCSYLLARDFVNGSFSVVLKAGEVPSYVVQAGKNYFEVSNSADLSKRITLNGVPYEQTPLSDRLSVTAIESLIVIKNNDFEFKFNLPSNVVTIDTRLGFFGKTAGLLGNYNREPSDDFQSPSGEPVADETALLKAWQTESCDNQEATLYKDRSEDVETVELCEKFFKDEMSTLSLGFLVHSPDKYHDLCLRAVNTNKVNEACQVAHAYLMEIDKYNSRPMWLGIRLPNECREYSPYY